MRDGARRRGACYGVGVLAILAFCWSAAAADENPAVARFEETIEPILIDYCYRCHADGMKKGDLAFDQTQASELVGKRELWLAVLKNVRSGLMPPAGKPRPSEAEVQQLAKWIKYDVFKIAPNDPDPGRSTIRRLNRAEYRSTIRDLMGYDFKAEEEFPPDDSGYGFDNIADVLSVSPLLLEKYVQAAESIIAAAVPTVSRLIPERTYRGIEFRSVDGTGNGERMSAYTKAKVRRLVIANNDGDYRLGIEIAVHGSFDYDPGRCTMTARLDEKELIRETYAWQDGKVYRYSFTEALKAGDHHLSFDIEPVPNPEPQKKKANTSVDVRIVSVKFQGPLDPKHWSHPKNYVRFFPRDEPPQGDAERREYAREVLARFATQAFRRPVDRQVLDRLVAMAEKIYHLPGHRFEQGVARAMVAVLASPRFVFRVEAAGPEASEPGRRYLPVDEYTLASRLSYFLWSTMPDAELFSAAEHGELRKNQTAQVKRMLNDPRSEALTRNFVGQWLQIRDVDGFTINTRAVLRQEGSRARIELDGQTRRAMRNETEMVFAHIAREDRSVLELIESDYTFLNGKLAELYGIQGGSGNQMRKVTLPKDSPRGGVLAHASVLLVTSNPTRTSPVKRGQFILENLLGTPAPPPPAVVPPLEDAKKEFKDREPTGRELLALHRAQPLCASCHARMDPLGLALENFNAMGLWRDKERGQPIDSTGKLLSGESFRDVRELKRILKEGHKADFYRCISEKFLTYALGRGLDYNDVDAVDRIVERLEGDGGRFSALLLGVIESTPFQKRRSVSAASTASSGG
jgi:mono/diheme cytochrome c family protein